MASSLLATSLGAEGSATSTTPTTSLLEAAPSYVCTGTVTITWWPYAKSLAEYHAVHELPHIAHAVAPSPARLASETFPVTRASSGLSFGVSESITSDDHPSFVIDAMLPPTETMRYAGFERSVSSDFVGLSRSWIENVVTLRSETPSSVSPVTKARLGSPCCGATPRSTRSFRE